MKKIVVIHSVAANGGDQLLLEALMQGLSQYCDAEIALVTTNSEINYSYINSKKCLNNEIFSYNHLRSYKISKIASYFISFSDIACKLIINRFNEINSVLKASECLILMPGGFLHEYYGYNEISNIIFYAKKIKKKVLLLGQSVGPFENSPETAKKLFDNIDLVILRENISQINLENIGVSKSKIYVTSDIALGFQNYQNQNDNSTKKIFMNFRTWQTIAEDDLLSKSKDIISIAISNGYQVELLSTCQGVYGYVDDSILSYKIYKHCIENNINKDYIYVNPAKYQPKHLIEYINKFGLMFIGMRLHMAISAILAEIPILNLYYEHKSPGILNNLGLNEYCISINNSTASINKAIESFIIENDKDEMIKIKNAKKIGENCFTETFNLLNSYL